MSFQTEYENYLMHHGVKGMRWGIRRERRRENRRIRKDRRKAVRERKTLNDNELNKRIQRLRAEKELKQLTEESIAPGRTAVKRALSTTGKVVLGAILTSVTMGTIHAIAKNTQKQINGVKVYPDGKTTFKESYKTDWSKVKSDLNIPAFIANATRQKK